MSGVYVKWPPIASGGSSGGSVGSGTAAVNIAFSVGTLDGQGATPQGASVSSVSLFMQSATATSPGIVNTLAQSFGGVKTFAAAPILSTLTLGNVVTVGSTNQVSSIPYTPNATAGQLVSRDANGATAALNFVSQTTQVQSSGTINLILTAASTRIQKVIGSNTIAGGVVLPIATNLYAGEIFEINNNTTQSLTIFNTGSTSLATSVAGSYAILICTDNTTSNGVWDIHWDAPTSTTWGTNGLNVTGSLTATSLTSAPVISNANGALTNGSVSLSNQVSGNLPLSQTTGSISLTNKVSGILPIANGGTNASAAATALANLSATVFVTTGDIVYANGTGFGAWNGSVTIVSANGKNGGEVLQLDNGTGLPTYEAVDISNNRSITGILPQANLTLTPTFTQTTIGSVTQTSSAGGQALTARWPGSYGDPGQALTISSAGFLSWQTPQSGASAPAKWNVVAKTANYSASINDLIVMSSASFTITLPDATASGSSGKSIIAFHNGLNFTQSYTFNTVSSQTITGAGGTFSGNGIYSFLTQGERAEFIPDGSNWFVVNHDTTTKPIAYAGATSGTGFGTLGSNTTWAERRGTKLRIWGSAVTGTVAASLASIGLPAGATLDSASMILNTSTGPGNRWGAFADNVGASDSGAMVTAPLTSTTLVYFGGLQTSSSKLVPINGSTLTGNGAVISYEFEVPVAGLQA